MTAVLNCTSAGSVYSHLEAIEIWALRRRERIRSAGPGFEARGGAASAEESLYVSARFEAWAKLSGHSHRLWAVYEHVTFETAREALQRPGETDQVRMARLGAMALSSHPWPVRVALVADAVLVDFRRTDPIPRMVFPASEEVGEVGRGPSNTRCEQCNRVFFFVGPSEPDYCRDCWNTLTVERFMLVGRKIRLPDAQYDLAKPRQDACVFVGYKKRKIA